MIFIPCITGILCGIFVGILPGVSASTLLMVIFPILYKFDIISLIVFYTCLISTSQYYGSISAIIFGIPGEVSSIPAIDNGHSLYREGMGTEALAYTSTGSFIAAFISICLISICLIALPSTINFLLKERFILIIILISMCIMVISSKNILKSTLSITIGLVVGKIGYDILTDSQILTFGWDQLSSGIPALPLFIGLIVLPTIINYSVSNPIAHSVRTVGIKERIHLLFNYEYIYSMVRGTIVGFITGMIPGGSYTISSGIAEKMEAKANSNILDNRMYRLVAAESANNSGSISVLIPLIVTAVPIVLSESLFLSIAQTKGFTFETSWSILIHNSYSILGCVMLANIVSWILAGVFFTSLANLYTCIKDWIYPFILCIVICLVVYNGISTNQILLNALVFVVSLGVGLLVVNEDLKTSFLYAYFISPILFDGMLRIYEKF